MDDSSLLCEESETCFDDDHREEKTIENDDGAFIINFNKSTTYCTSENEYVEILLERENTSFGSKQNHEESFVFSNWLKRARFEAITWILKTRAVFGFKFRTAYLSMTYFDRFLSRRSINNEKMWAIRLVSVGCISLAAKMEELTVPVLSEFQFGDYNFESRVIQKMELLILNTLEWKMGSITPYAFIPFFITNLCKESFQTSHLVSKTLELIWAVMKEINLVNYRPSVIAVAAILAAMYGERLAKKEMEKKIDSIVHSRFLQIEEVVLCYDLMLQELIKVEGFEEEEEEKTEYVSNSANDVMENSSITSEVSSKRKRPTFNYSDHHYAFIADTKRTS